MSHPRYAALLTDANSARIFVFGLGETLETEQAKGKKVGGWSQARYQRRVDNAHQDHAKEVIETLDRIVRDEQIRYIVFGGDPQMIFSTPAGAAQAACRQGCRRNQAAFEADGSAGV